MFVKGTDHQNYCDTYLIASKHLLRRPKVLGTGVDPRRMMSELEKMIPAFFACEDYGKVPKVVESYDEGQQSLHPSIDVESSTGIELLSTTSFIASEDKKIFHVEDLKEHFSLFKKVDHVYHRTLQLTPKTCQFMEKHIVHESDMVGLADDTYFKKFNP